ncbi:MAG: hypothetical protein ACFB15_19650 [Cyclobacteriaceae bacterium]
MRDKITPILMLLLTLLIVSLNQVAAQTASSSCEVNSAYSYEVTEKNCGTNTLSFVADSIADEYEYRWHLDNQIIGRNSSLTYVARVGEVLRISLKVLQGTCNDITTEIITIEDEGPNGLGNFQWELDDQTNCDRQAITFVSDSINPSFTYQWKKDRLLLGEDHSVSFELKPGVHNVRLIINDGECVYATQQVIEIPENTPEKIAGFSYISPETALCDIQKVEFQADSLNDTFSYQWAINGKTVSEEENFTYELEPGVFEVSLEVEIGRCSYEFSQQITVEEAPQANAGTFEYATEILDCGQWALSAIALQGSSTATYQWWLNDELVSEEERVSKSIPSGDYTLTLQTQIGSCSYETQKILSLSSPQADLLVNVPNVLSPQAIHPDDRTIKVYGKCIADEGFHFQIADRWGGLVYQTKNANEVMTQGWNGDNASSGINTYVLKGQFNSGTTFQQQGTITLLK